MNFNHQPPRKPTPSHDEEQLIAFHLGEPSDDRAIRARMESDPEYAALSHEVAHTLRVFSTEPVPAPNIEAAWQRLRGTLPELEAAPRASRWRWFTLAPIAALALILVTAGLALWHRHASRPQVDEAGVLHLRPPTGSADVQGVTQHLDRAERWLTVVNHTTSPLDETTRAEGQQLLTRNALYLQDARSRGDLPDAAVLDRLGRVLTTANHPDEGGIHLRVEMNTDGLLFDLRVLRQNQNQSSGDSR